MKELSSLGFTVGDAPSLVKSEQSTIDTEKVSNHLPTRQGMEKSSQERLEEQLTKGSVELSTPTMMVILRTPKQEKRKQPRIEELDKQHGEEFHGKEIPLADVDHQVEEVERSLSKEELVLKALDEIGDLDKSKYIRREGGPGNYKYTYKEPVGRQPAAESAPQAESSPQPQNEAREKYKRKELKKLETNLKSLEFAVGSAKSWIKKYGSVSNIPKNERDRFHSINLVDEQNKVTRQLRAMSISSIDVPKEMASKRDSLFREVEALSKLNKSESVEMPKDKFVAEHKKLVGVLESPSKKDDKKEAKEQKKELKEVEKGKDRCWDGYKPTPGKKPYSEGSCTKKAEDEKFDFDGNKKPDAHEKQHKKIAEKLDKKKVDKSLDSLVEMLSDQTDMRKLKRVHENTVQRPQVPYQFVRSMGKGGIVFNFGTKTGNIFADKATELLTQNADPIQQATVQNQDQAYQKALDSYVQTGQATFEMQTSNEKTLEKGFDQQVKEAYENGTLYDDPSKPAVQNEYNKAQLKMNGEVIKATSETDAALIEMMQSQSDTENDGSVVIDATQGGKQSVTVEC
ncbi:hypothetical protein EBR03_05420 [bacterium]|nr:hypothetical protein [bacterium]